jgi:hypothetical protein
MGHARARAGFTVRPARVKKQKAFNPCKSENEGISDPNAHKRDGLASSFSLAEKSAAAHNEAGDHDEHNQADILTSGINLAPAFPVFQWLWESVTRYSGATVPDSHGVPWRMAVISNFQRASLFTPKTKVCQENSSSRRITRPGSEAPANLDSPLIYRKPRCPCPELVLPCRC